MGHRNGRNLSPVRYVVEEAWTERVGSVEYEDVAVPWLADFESPLQMKGGEAVSDAGSEPTGTTSSFDIDGRQNTGAHDSRIANGKVVSR